MFLDRVLTAKSKVLTDFLLRGAHGTLVPLVEQELIDLVLSLCEAKTHTLSDTGFLNRYQVAIGMNSWIVGSLTLIAVVNEWE